MEGFHDRSGNAQTISATIRRRAAGEGSSVFSRCRGRRRRAGGCGRCCDTHGRPGAHANIWERQEGIFARASAIEAARHQNSLQHSGPAALKRPISVAPDTCEGRHGRARGCTRGMPLHIISAREHRAKASTMRCSTEACYMLQDDPARLAHQHRGVISISAPTSLHGLASGD
jgi:hypothetical protein